MKKSILFILALIFTSGIIYSQSGISAEKISVTDFHTIIVKGSFEVIIKQGNSPEVSLETTESMKPYINIKSSEGTLDIEHNIVRKFFSPSSMKVYITATSRLNVIIASNGAAVRMISPFNTKKFVVDLLSTSSFQSNERIDTDLFVLYIGKSSNVVLSAPVKTIKAEIYNFASSEISATIEASEINFDGASSSKATLSGTTDIIKVTMAGNSRLNSAGLNAKKVEASTRTGAKAALSATESFVGVRKSFSSIECVGKQPKYLNIQ